MPSHVSSLCLLLSCLAFVRAAPPPLAHLSNASLWGFLPYDDWWVRLQGEVVHPLAATARLPPPPDLSARLGTDKVALSKLEGNPAFHWVRRELQCQLTFLSLVCGALASVYPELLGHARQRPAGPLDWRQQWSVPEMARDLERRLLLITSALQRNQTVAALELSTHAAMVLGWKWQGVHVTALADPAPAASGSAGNGRPNNSHSSVDGTMSVASQLGLCWDEVAVLNVLSDPDTWPDGNTLAALMHHGALADPWQSHLEDFFQGSREHVHPGATAGNIRLLAGEPPAEGPPGPELGATVEWGLPADAFQDRVTMPSREEAEVFESGGFVAAGFPWYAQIIVDDIANVSLAARMWGQHSLPAADGPGLFRITLTAMREGPAGGVAGSPGGDDMAIRWLCEWDPSLGAFHSCAYPASLPLWKMLSGGTLPGFESHGELLFTATVESLPPHSESCGGSSPALSGPPGSPPRLLASPLLRWAQQHADPRLWGTLGFASRRRPGGSAEATDTLMQAAVAARFAPAPWLRGRLQAAAEELMSMDAGQATLWSLELPGLAGRLAEAIAATQLASAVGLLAFPLTAPLLHAGGQGSAERGGHSIVLDG